MKKMKLKDLINIRTGKLDANASSENGKYPFFTCSKETLKINEYSYDCECVLLAGNGDLNVKYYNGKFDAYQRTYILECKNDIISTKYLYYFMKKYLKILRNQSIGGVIKYIKLANISEAIIPIYSEEEQEEIVNNISKVEEVLNIKNKQIEELNNLIKSQFVEMFGDIHLNDKKWEKFVKMNEICEINPKKSEISDLRNIMVSFVPMQSVTEDGKIYTDDKRNINDVKSGFTYFRENDVLFAKITPCMENGKGAIAVNLENKIGFGSTEFHVIRPGKYVNPLWIYTLTATKEFRKQAEMSMTGSAGQKRVSYKYLENYRIGVPPITLQNEFSEIVKQIDKQKFESMIQLDKENRIVLRNIIKDTLEETNSIYEFLLKKYFEEGK